MISFSFLQEYTSKDLKGLKVEHSVDRFKDGQSIILTLQDKGDSVH